MSASTAEGIFSRSPSAMTALLASKSKQPIENPTNSGSVPVISATSRTRRDSNVRSDSSSTSHRPNQQKEVDSFRTATTADGIVALASLSHLNRDWTNRVLQAASTSDGNAAEKGCPESLHWPQVEQIMIENLFAHDLECLKEVASINQALKEGLVKDEVQPEEDPSIQSLKESILAAHTAEQVHLLESNSEIVESVEERRKALSQPKISKGQLSLIIKVVLRYAKNEELQDSAVSSPPPNSHNPLSRKGSMQTSTGSPTSGLLSSAKTADRSEVNDGNEAGESWPSPRSSSGLTDSAKARIDKLTSQNASDATAPKLSVSMKRFKKAASTVFRLVSLKSSAVARSSKNSLSLAEKPESVILKIGRPELLPLMKQEGCYLAEVNFYAHIAPILRNKHNCIGVIPACYGAFINNDSHQFCLLLENLTETRSAESPELLQGCTAQQAQSMLRGMASFHGNTWRWQLLEDLTARSNLRTNVAHLDKAPPISAVAEGRVELDEDQRRFLDMLSSPDGPLKSQFGEGLDLQSNLETYQAGLNSFCALFAPAGSGRTKGLSESIPLHENLSTEGIVFREGRDYIELSGVPHSALDIAQQLRGKLLEVLLLSRRRGTSLIHGELRLDNVMFYSDSEGDASKLGSSRVKAVFLDWQSCCRGLPACDVAWVIGACLSDKQRREFGHTLLQQYHKRLLKHGVSSAYTFGDEFISDFKLGLLLVFAQVSCVCVSWRAMMISGVDVRITGRLYDEAILVLKRLLMAIVEFSANTTLMV